jgi:DNA-binding response OmpR family regulator
MTLDSGQKTSILIVEDEPMLAFVLEEFLIESGFNVVGIAGRLNTALALIESCIFDIAILDANLAGISAGPAALALTARGLPFIVISGYLPEQQTAAFSGAPRIQKPFRPDQLVHVLRGILAGNDVIWG